MKRPPSPAAYFAQIWPHQQPSGQPGGQARRGRGEAGSEGGGELKRAWQGTVWRTGHRAWPCAAWRAVAGAGGMNTSCVSVRKAQEWAGCARHI